MTNAGKATVLPVEQHRVILSMDYVSFAISQMLRKHLGLKQRFSPHHIGAYEITVQDEDGSYFAFSYWNGERWSWICWSAETAYMQACFGNFTNKLYKWRGILK